MSEFWALAPALTILTLIAGALANPLETYKALLRLIAWLHSLEDREDNP